MKVRQGLTFDDLLLVPRYSVVISRNLISLDVDLGKNIKLKVPIVSANMKDITEIAMVKAIADFGGLPILHRFTTLKNQLAMLNEAQHNKNLVGCSIGVKKNDYENACAFVNSGCSILCVDIAHADSLLCLKMTEKIAKTFPEVLLISGNVATAGGARRLCDAGADVVKVGIGPGCHAAGTRILMSNGIYKNIEDIVPGDRVINKEGNSVTVLQLFCSGIKLVNKIRHSLFYKPTYVTPDHQHWISDLKSTSKETVSSHGYSKCLETKPQNGQSKYKWKEIKNTSQSCLLIPKNINFELEKYFKVKINKRIGRNGKNGSPFKYNVDCVLEPSYDCGYFFGTFLGDGHAMQANNGKTDIGSIHWYFGKNEWPIVNKLKMIIKKVSKKEPTITIKENIIQCSLYYKPLADYLISFGKRHNKHLPQNLLVNNRDYLMGLYDGLMDGDGNIEPNGRKEFTNTSPRLIELFNIVSYLITGIFPNNEKTREPSIGKLKNVNIENCLPSFRASVIKSGEKKLTNDYQIIKILENENIQLQVLTYDIGVNCETHSFIANNVIVHNSLCTTRIETGAGVPQMTALYDVFTESIGITNERKFKIIADGGIRRAGDCVKALCFSDAVMLGSILAGTDEAPGNMGIDMSNGRIYKTYAGSSTHKTSRVEGVVKRVICKGPIKPIIVNLIEGIQSGLSYQGCKNLEELREDPEFIQISPAGLIESYPHSHE